MHFAYILYSPSADRFYVGESARPDERLLHHLAGPQRFTKGSEDWAQVFLKDVPDRTTALHIEQRIKTSKSRKTILRWIRGDDHLITSDIWQHMIP